MASQSSHTAAVSPHQSQSLADKDFLPHLSNALGFVCVLRFESKEKNDRNLHRYNLTLSVPCTKYRNESLEIFRRKFYSEFVLASIAQF